MNSSPLVHDDLLCMKPGQIYLLGWFWGQNLGFVYQILRALIWLIIHVLVRFIDQAKAFVLAGVDAVVFSGIIAHRLLLLGCCTFCSSQALDSGQAVLYDIPWRHLLRTGNVSWKFVRVHEEISHKFHLKNLSLLTFLTVIVRDPHLHVLQFDLEINNVFLWLNFDDIERWLSLSLLQKHLICSIIGRGIQKSALLEHR